MNNQDRQTDASRLADLLDTVAAFLREQDPPIVYLVTNVHDDNIGVGIQVARSKADLPAAMDEWAKLLGSVVTVTSLPDSDQYVTSYGVRGSIGSQPVDVYGYVPRVLEPVSA